MTTAELPPASTEPDEAAALVAYSRVVVGVVDRLAPSVANLRVIRRTRGGTSGNVVRSTTPSSSSALKRRERVRGEMPSSERSSSQKRERPSARSRMTRSVHLPQTMSAVRQTGQSEFGTNASLAQDFNY